MNRHFDYNLSSDYTQTFKDKFWFQHAIQIQTAEGPVETKACIRDLDDSLRKALHDKHKLGQSKQDSLFFQLWDKVQPFRVKPHSDALWTMPSIPDSHKKNIFKCRTGQIWNKNIAFKRRMPYMPGQPIARDTRCPLCRGDDSQGHIFGSCMHLDMSNQYIARHDKAMRTVIQAFTKGRPSACEDVHLSVIASSQPPFTLHSPPSLSSKCMPQQTVQVLMSRMLSISSSSSNLRRCPMQTCCCLWATLMLSWAVKRSCGVVLLADLVSQFLVMAPGCCTCVWLTLL